MDLTRKLGGSILLILVVIGTFAVFSPTTYGISMSTNYCNSLKWRKNWDLNCGNVVKNDFIQTTPVYSDGSENIEVKFIKEEDEE